MLLVLLLSHLFAITAAAAAAAAAVAQAVIELQRRLPNARVMYVSATGAYVTSD
jgi:hypothetical protein